MNRETIYTLIMNWCKESISHDFSHKEMDDCVSLIGFDSISVVELCEYLENNLGVEVDYESVWDCTSLSDLSHALEDRVLSLAS